MLEAAEKPAVRVLRRQIYTKFLVSYEPREFDDRANLEARGYGESDRGLAQGRLILVPSKEDPQPNLEGSTNQATLGMSRKGLCKKEIYLERGPMGHT